MAKKQNIKPKDDIIIYKYQQYGEVDIWIQGEYWKSCTLKEFDEMMLNLQVFELFKDSVRKGRMRLSIEESPGGKKPGSTYKTMGILTCVSSDGRIVWQKIFNLNVYIPKDNKSKLKIYYEKTAKWGFPVTSAGCIFFFLAWLL